MSKLLVRICALALAASFALALTPVAGHASGLTARPATLSVHASWLDAARTSLATLLPGLVSPSASAAGTRPPGHAPKSHLPRWLRPTCGSAIDPWGHCI